MSLNIIKKRMYILVIITLTLLITSSLYVNTSSVGCVNSEVTGVSPMECFALVDLYESTNGAQWTNKTNWLNFEVPVNNWYGVTANNAVRKIELQNNNLVGSIPASIGDFAAIETLNLSRNKLSGQIPFDLAIQTYSSLMYLYLNDNLLSGQIPSNFSGLYLSELHLQNNKLVGNITVELLHGIYNGFAESEAYFYGNCLNKMSSQVIQFTQGPSNHINDFVFETQHASQSAYCKNKLPVTPSKKVKNK